MPTVIINDVVMEARVGEPLLDVARRNAAHIGFVCDGNGICQTCQCRVLSGSAYLSPPNRAERIWMPARRLASGHRLACQVALRGSGQVEIITKAEELRRQLQRAMMPQAGPEEREPLLDNLARMNIDQLLGYPFNVLATMLRVGPLRFFFPIRDVDRWTDDGARVAQHVAATAARPRPVPLRDTAPARVATGDEARLLRAAEVVRSMREMAAQPPLV